MFASCVLRRNGQRRNIPRSLGLGAGLLASIRTINTRGSPQLCRPTAWRQLAVSCNIPSAQTRALATSRVMTNMATASTAVPWKLMVGAQNNRNVKQPCAVLPAQTSLLAVAPLAAIPAHGYSETVVWLFESCIGIGFIKMGVPGLVAQTFFVSPIPVFKRIIAEKSVGQLPLLPYSSMFVNGLLWCSYGALLGNPAIWVCNAPPIIFGAVYTGLYMKHCPADANWLPGTKSLHLAGIAAACAFVGGLVMTQEADYAANIVGTAAVGICVIMFVGPLTALNTVLKAKNTKSLPFPMMVATVANCSLWCFYGAEIIHDPFIWFPNLLGLLSGLAQAALFMRFGIHR